MIDALKSLSEISNVSGAEGVFSRFVLGQIRENGIFAKRDFMGNVITSLSGSQNHKKKILICIPMDLPGYLALYKEGKKLYLSPTNEEKGQKKDKTILWDERNRSFPLRFENSNAYILKEDGAVGDVFRKKMDFSGENGKIKGLYASRFALIHLGLALTQMKFQNDVVIAFAAKFHTRALTECHLVRRISPDICVFLGVCEDSNRSALVLLKDGKAFSDREEIRCLGNKALFREIVSDERITKAEDVTAFCNVPTLTFSLPAKGVGTEKESFHLSALEKLKTLLSRY